MNSENEMRVAVIKREQQQDGQMGQCKEKGENEIKRMKRCVALIQ